MEPDLSLALTSLLVSASLLVPSSLSPMAELVPGLLPRWPHQEEPPAPVALSLPCEAAVEAAAAFGLHSTPTQVNKLTSCRPSHRVSFTHPHAATPHRWASWPPAAHLVVSLSSLRHWAAVAGFVVDLMWSLSCARMHRTRTWDTAFEAHRLFDEMLVEDPIIRVLFHGRLWWLKKCSLCEASK
jgi:hypothetical protein